MFSPLRPPERAERKAEIVGVKASPGNFVKIGTACDRGKSALQERGGLLR